MCIDAGDRCHQALMDRKYRRQRHVFDLTRKCFLLGRGRAMAMLEIGEGETVLEIGCGTARNIDLMMLRHPTARFVGVDISREMLKSAEARVARRGYGGRVTLLHGDAAALGAIPGLAAGYGRILMSYLFSMVPDWPRALAAALVKLAPGGRLAIVDFGDFHGWSSSIARAAIGSLSRHNAPPCLDLLARLERRAAEGRLALRHEWGLGGFYQIAIVERLPEAR